jgi:putative transposase
MKMCKFTESQIIGILKQQELGKPVNDICREHGISQGTFYQWKIKYSGMEVAQLKRMKDLEAELSQYKRIVAEQSLQITVLKDVIEEKL